MGRLGHQGAVLTAALALLCLLPAQEVTFKADVALVRLLVTVKDAKGALIGTLQQGDFAVFDSGVEQQVAVFEHHTEYPLSIAVVVDTSGSTNRILESELDSIERFLTTLLREGNPADAAALYSFNDEVTLLTSYTRRFQRLRDSLRRVKATSGTSLYDAIYLASGALENREGRHVIVVVTDGGDTTSAKSFADALRAAHAADAAVYPILVRPIAGEPGRNLGGERALERLASDTGGRVFTSAVGAQLDAAFTQILRDLRTQYLLGYYPRNLPPGLPQFHPVRVEVKLPGLRATTRSGYYEDAGPN
jgi:Ca-activated chloride channel family protein